MKIAFFLGRFPLLSETFVLNQITGLIERGHRVEIYADEAGEKDIVHPEVERYRLLDATRYLTKPPSAFKTRLIEAAKIVLANMVANPKPLAEALNYLAYRKYALSLKLLFPLADFIAKPATYDIIHCHFGLNGVRALALRNAGLIKGRIVTTFHGADITAALLNYGNGIYRRLFRGGDLFLPISEKWRTELINLGAPEEKTFVHHMGIKCSDVARRIREDKSRDHVQLISVCRLVEKKGIEYAVRAVAKLKAGNTQIVYHIVGDGPLKNELQECTRKLGVAGNVVFHGAKNSGDVKALLESGDIFVLPSVTAANGDQEGIPVSLMEAMAMSLPVVSTFHSGIPELVSHEESGLLVLERDVDALTDAIGILAGDGEMRARMGALGRQKIEEQYNIDKLNDELLKKFEELLYITSS